MFQTCVKYWVSVGAVMGVVQDLEQNLPIHQILQQNSLFVAYFTV